MALGGMMICCSDYNIGSDTLGNGKPCKIGLNETAINLPMPLAGVEFTRFRCPPPHFALNQAVGMIYDSKGSSSDRFQI